MAQDPPPENPDPPDSTSPSGGAPDVTLETLFRVTRRFLVPFLFSWLIAYVGGERGVEWLYYAGLGGVGLSVIGLLLWLLHH